MMTDIVNLLTSGGGLISGIVVAFASFGWWLRRERVEAAKAQNIIAETELSTQKHNGQSTELADLRQRLSQIERVYIEQQNQVRDLLNKISELEARIIGASTHHENLILCDMCRHNNAKILEALNKTLVGKEETPPAV